MAVATPLRQLCQELIALMSSAISIGTRRRRGRHSPFDIIHRRCMKLMEFYHERRFSFRE
ncbi:hypothetical protein A9K71_12730 [Mesorhizobium sp. WSM3873]|nr:hypothetical protein A9K71_12730 [Mesorhizobium sp. WSM3873]